MIARLVLVLLFLLTVSVTAFLPKGKLTCSKLRSQEDSSPQGFPIFKS